MMDSMIQTYNDMEGQVRQFQSLYNGEGQLQKVYSSARYVSVSLRSKGETIYLFFGRGKGYEGFWTGKRQIPATLRKKDRFLEYLRKRLSGARLIEIRQDREDRVLYVDYRKFGKKNTLGMFYKGRILYFACFYYNPKKERFELFKSWGTAGEAGETMSKDVLEEAFEEAGKEGQDKTRQSGAIPEIEELLSREEKDAAKRRGSRKEKRFARRKAANIERDLEKARRWKDVRSWLDAGPNLEELPSRALVEGVKIKFTETSHYRRRDELFAKIKKLKRGEAILERRLEQTRRDAGGKEDGAAAVANSLTVLSPAWSSSAARREEPAGKPRKDAAGYTVLKEDIAEFGMGKTAKGNDQMRKLWAKKHDWWFHLDGRPGPHIIAKIPKGAVDEAVLKRVAEMMAEKTGEREINLIYTQVKNLKGVAGKPGSVNYKKEKRARVDATADQGANQT